MARDGYTTMEDLACRWTTADLARTQSPTDLKFKDGENGFDQQGSNFTAMRVYQAVLQAKNMFQSGLTSGAAAPGSLGVSRSNLDALCDRIAMEKDWISGTPKPRLEYQGSDAFLKKQFKYCAKGEIGYFAPKHIVSALPEEGECPTKSHRRFTVDGFEKEEEEEKRPNPQTRRQLERMHTVFRNNLLMCLLAFPQFQQFDLCKSDLDDWYDWFYGPEIAGRKPPPSETTLLWAEWNAWRQICQLMADGVTLKNSLKQMKENQLFWTREVYERIMFQQPESRRGKEKEKGRARPSQSKGSIRTTSNPHPVARRAEENLRRASPREDAPVVGQLTGRSNPQRESPTAGTSISSILAKAIATDRMRAQSRSMGGPAMGITPQTSAPTGANLEPSRGAYSPQGPASGERGPTNEEPNQAQTDGIPRVAPTFVSAKVNQFPKSKSHHPPPGASATVRPTPPDFSMVPPPPEAPNNQIGAQLTPPTTIQSLQTLFPWIASVPERLQHKLLWGSDIAPLGFQTPGQLLLYVGPADSKSLDSTLHQMAPALKGHVLRRESDHDILQGPLYDQLCTHAWRGDLQGAGGGPNCRSWSILRWFPKPGAPVPVRGRPEPECWGLSTLQPQEQMDTDNDSLLLLRLMVLAHVIHLRFKGKGLPWCFLEHPEDPKLCSKSPNASRCSTIWQTHAVRQWCRTLGLATIHFDQCELGQCVAKSTVLAADLPLRHWTGMTCTHGSHQKPSGVTSSDLSRYPPMMMRGLAQSIVTHTSSQFGPPPSEDSAHSLQSSGVGTPEEPMGGLTTTTTHRLQALPAPPPTRIVLTAYNPQGW